MSADFYTGFAPVSTGLFLNAPFGIVRNDHAGLLYSVANGNLYPPQGDSYGSVRVTEEGGIPTYFATSTFACDSTATDIAIFPGSTSVIARLLWVLISSTATAAATGDFLVIRRSAANTGGTAVNATVGRADMTDGAPNCQPQHYTAHPTALGAANGNLYAQRYIQPAAASTLLPGFLIDFRQWTGGKGIRVAASATDIIALNAAASLGGSGNGWDITWCWVELPTTA